MLLRTYGKYMYQCVTMDNKYINNNDFYLREITFERTYSLCYRSIINMVTIDTVMLDYCFFLFKGILYHTNYLQ